MRPCPDIANLLPVRVTKPVVNDFLSRSRLGRPGLDKKNIPILDHVILPLSHHLPGRLNRRLIPQLFQHLKVENNTLNERLLEIGMYNPGSLRSLGALPDCPLPHLVRARGEETAEVHHLAHGDDDFGEGGLGAEFFALLVGGGVVLEAGEALFKGDGERDDGVAGGVLFDPLSDFREVFVFLADVVFFAEVDEVDDWFGGEEHEGVDDFDLL